MGLGVFRWDDEFKKEFKFSGLAPIPGGLRCLWLPIRRRRLHVVQVAFIESLSENLKGGLIRSRVPLGRRDRRMPESLRYELKRDTARRQCRCETVPQVVEPEPTPNPGELLRSIEIPVHGRDGNLKRL